MDVLVGCFGGVSLCWRFGFGDRVFGVLFGASVVVVLGCGGGGFGGWVLCVSGVDVVCGCGCVWGMCGVWWCVGFCVGFLAEVLEGWLWVFLGGLCVCGCGCFVWVGCLL